MKKSKKKKIVKDLGELLGAIAKCNCTGSQSIYLRLFESIVW